MNIGLIPPVSGARVVVGTTATTNGQGFASVLAGAAMAGADDSEVGEESSPITADEGDPESQSDISQLGAKGTTRGDGPSTPDAPDLIPTPNIGAAIPAALARHIRTEGHRDSEMALPAERGGVPVQQSRMAMLFATRTDTAMPAPLPVESAHPMGPSVAAGAGPDTAMSHGESVETEPALQARTADGSGGPPGSTPQLARALDQPAAILTADIRERPSGVAVVTFAQPTEATSLPLPIAPGTGARAYFGHVGTTADVGIEREYQTVFPDKSNVELGHSVARLHAFAPAPVIGLVGMSTFGQGPAIPGEVPVTASLSPELAQGATLPMRHDPLMPQMGQLPQTDMVLAATPQLVALAQQVSDERSEKRSPSVAEPSLLGAALASGPAPDNHFRSEMAVIQRAPSAMLPDLREPLLQALAAGDGQLELDTGQDALGKLKLTVRMVDGVMQVTFVSGRPEALDMLRRSLGLLVRDMSMQGFQDVTVRLGPTSTQASLAMAYHLTVPGGKKTRTPSDRPGSDGIDKRL